MVASHYMMYDGPAKVLYQSDTNLYVCKKENGDIVVIRNNDRGTIIKEGNSLINVKEKNMFSNFKNYVLKYKDWFFTIGMLLLVDHFVFNGAFKKKVQERVSKVLEKV